MRRMNRYLGKQLLFGTGVALLALLTIDTIVGFLDEIEKLSLSYTLLQIVTNSLLEIVISVYDLLPIAVLLGCIISLSNLAVNAEFLALRAAGYARIQLSAALLRVGVLLMASIFIYGETVVPWAHAKQYQNKHCCENHFHFFKADRKYWFHEADYFINFEEFQENIYRTVGVFELNKNYQLARYIEAPRALASPAKKNWLLEDVTLYSFTEKNVMQVEQREQLELPITLNHLANSMPEVFMQEHMNILQLTDYIDFLEANTLHSEPYQLAFWTRFNTALSVLVMILLATPWLFAATQRATMGKRFFSGVLIGLVYMIVSQISGNLSIVYALPIWFGVFLPSVLFSGVGLYLLQRVR